MIPAIATLFTVLNAGEVDASLDRFAWSHRPILVFAGAEDDPRLAAQLDALRAAALELAERDNVVIVDRGGDSALARRFRPNGFTVILVGKDGGEKLRRTEVTPPQDLNDLIDTMPMRRREMREDGQTRP
ncbi:MAG: DUF4174 domain-containing protein [Pseudomonadota bacterium]